MKRLWLGDTHEATCKTKCLKSQSEASSCLSPQCQLPGMARDVFSHRETFKRPPLFGGGGFLLLLLSCGYFCSAECILGNTQAFRRKCSLPLKKKKKLPKSVSLSYFSGMSLFVFSSLYMIYMNSFFIYPWFSSHLHRSPRHVKHPPTMNWWVFAWKFLHARTCVCVGPLWKLLKTLLTCVDPSPLTPAPIIRRFFLELWQKEPHAANALSGRCRRSEVTC